ncbi:MAG: ABC transporter ATP-binding protein [Bacteroidota bacterium]
MPDLLLRIDELSISFDLPNTKDDFLAVDGISFQFHQGEVLGIVGESGSGKSLTALSIMGLLPDQAQLEVKGIHFGQTQTSLHQLSPKAYEKIRGNDIGMIFQEPMSSLNPVFKCGFQIEETLTNNLKLSKKDAILIAKEWLQKVGITDIERVYTSYPHQLSGGQKQRVMIAIAMCCNPKLLIADEPTTALDVTIQKKVLDLLIQLKEETGTSILFISHDLAVIREIADRVLVMQKGKIVEVAEVNQIFSKPQHPYTRGLIACRPQLGKSYHRLPTLTDFLNNTPKNDEQGSIIKPKSSAQTLKLLQLDKISVHYKEQALLWKSKATTKAVDQVSLSIHEGETLGLVGESGCGKSSIAKAIAQLTPVTSGNILYKGKAFHEIAKKSYYQQVQMIFQDPNSALNPRIPAGEAILEPLYLNHRGPRTQLREKVYELLNLVGLDQSSYSKYPHQFSGGQKQRLCIARALVVEPDLLICDEVVSALDVSVQAQILNLLKDIQSDKGLSILFISHDLSVVEFMSDRIAVMRTGKIQEIGKASEIYQNPQSEYTRQLIAAIPGQSF